MRIRWMVFFILAAACLEMPGQSQTLMVPTPAEKHQYLVRTGVAYDASENIFGFIKIKEPKSFFPVDTDQFTWWGEFKPFKTWGRPELEARWYSPDGKLVSVQQFKGLHCRLAKTTLNLKQAGITPQEGRWRVDVHFKGKLLDSKPFVSYNPVKGAPPSQQTFQTVTSPTIVLETEYQNQDVHI